RQRRRRISRADWPLPRQIADPGDSRPFQPSRPAERSTHPYNQSHMTSLARRKTLVLGLVLDGLSIVPWRAAINAAARPPKLEHQRFKLPNGLTVLLHQDRS